MKLSHKQVGFTIVELLVVIVVIAILATISIIVFRGMQERAYNTKIVAMVQQYSVAIEQYRAAYGNYPTTTPEDEDATVATVCLGEGYHETYCGTITNVETYEDQAFHAKMDEFMSGRPQVNDQLLPAGPEEFIGAVYGNDMIHTQAGDLTQARTIQYALHGTDADCVLPRAWAYRAVTEPRPTTACIIELELYSP